MRIAQSEYDSLESASTIQTKDIEMLLNQIKDESTLKRAVKSEGDYQKLFEEVFRLHK
jgi:hypothetical protein